MACEARVAAPQGARMNNPVRAYERSEWRSAGYRLQLCLIVWKTGFYNLSRLSDAGGGGMPATPHFVPTALVRGYYISGHKAPQPVLRTIILIVTKALACVYFYRQKDKRNIRISPTKSMFLMFLCLNKLSLCLYRRTL
jgi:hypothetical protein